MKVRKKIIIALIAAVAVLSSVFAYANTKKSKKATNKNKQLNVLTFY